MGHARGAHRLSDDNSALAAAVPGFGAWIVDVVSVIAPRLVALIASLASESVH